jgi:hypothetical protein
MDTDRGAIDAELAEMLPLLGDRQSTYWRGPKAETMQERYRALIAARDNGTPLPPGPSAEERELLEIKSMMGNRTSAYWRGPRSATLQARYRELLEKRGAR